MIFRQAKAADAHSIRALYASVKGTPFCTWNEEYPGDFEITEDLKAGTLFVLEDSGVIIGAISVVPENEMDDFDCWTQNVNAREFARVTIAPKRQGEGLSRRLVSGVMAEMRKTGVPALHISVAEQNVPAQKLYRSMGFSFVGEKDMYGHHFYLCEKIL